MLSSHRLQCIAQMVGDQYSQIWDCCCDHGQLGIELLNRRAGFVHFVDCVEHLTDSLEQTLGQNSAYTQRWAVHCQDVCQLQLNDEPDQLMIIAGVGGDTCIEMIEQLTARHPQQQLSFIVCPVRQQERLRAACRNLSLGVLQESLTQERGRFYEVMHLRQSHSRQLGPIAQDIWQQGSPTHRRYIQDRIAYLSHQSVAHRPYIYTALQSYKALLIRLFNG